MTRLMFYAAFLLSLTLPTLSPAADPPIHEVPPSKNPQSVVYVCDASKSMTNSFAVFTSELFKALDSLKFSQSFSIIFLVDGKAMALDKGLLPASPENKRKAITFIKSITPAGATTAIPGMRAAFAAKPEVIYFATDGGFSDQPHLIDEIRKLNKDKRVQIHTIAMFTRGEAYEKILKQIADENAGLFRFVSDEGLKHPPAPAH